MFNSKGVGERELQVIILHSLVIGGSARVPPLCSTINSLYWDEEEVDSEEERQEAKGKRPGNKVGGSSYAVFSLTE